MTSEKRDFVNFDEFPGNIVHDDLYEFPTIRHVDSNDNTRIWKISVRLVKDGSRQTEINWDLLKEKTVPIKKEYFGTYDDYRDLPAKVIAEEWTESGVEDGKITRSTPSYFSDVAFNGQINQRNPFQQALIDARAKYLKKKDQLGASKKSTAINVMYYPMLAKTWKDGAKHIKYPAFVQPKLDGVRCLTYLKKKNGGVESVVMYTRNHKEFPSMDYLKTVLYDYLNDLYDEEKNQSIYLDGELYKHGKKLQDITSNSTNPRNRPNTKSVSTDSQTEKNKVAKAKTKAFYNEYHIYDCFFPLDLNVVFESRAEQLGYVFEAMNERKDTTAMNLIKPVPTYKVQNEDEAQKYFAKFVKMGYEGAIMRNADGVYLAGKKTSASMRSKDLVKMKQRFTDEFEVVGFTEGDTGKDVGAMIWIVKTPDGKKFNVTPKNTTYAARKKLYSECKECFDKYIGRMLSVEYEDLSAEGIPLRAKALVFRDYE